MQNRILKKRAKRKLIKRRVRGSVRGTAERPRFSVFKSLRHISVQAIDDETGTTVACASSYEPEERSIATMADKARAVGRKAAERLKEKGISSVVFDRNGRPYHGTIKVLAEQAREAGLVF